MRKRQKGLQVFITILFLTALVSLLFSSMFGKSLQGFSETLLVPIQKIVLGSIRSVSGQGKSIESEEKKIEDLTKAVTVSELLRENSALRDQFQIQTPSPKTLLPATILNFKTFIPGVSHPENIIVDKGDRDGIRKGMAVIYKGVLLGIVAKTSSSLSEISLLTNDSISLTAQTKKTQASGVAKGQGNGDIKLENVVMNEKLEKDDVVLTKGDVELSGVGVAPGLVVGIISSIEKSPSALFQTAKITSPIDITDLKIIFIQTM